MAPRDLEVMHLGNERRALPRIALVQPGDIGEHDEEIGADQRSDEGGQAIVVAELYLIDADGVVLVDHRDRAEAEQLAEGGSRVEVTATISEVIVRQQHLADGEPARAEGLAVDLDQVPLSDGGRGLQSGEIGGPLFEAQARDAERDRAGRDDHDFFAFAAQLRGLAGEHVDARVQIVPEQATADLDDHALRRVELRARAHAVRAAQRSSKRARKASACARGSRSWPRPKRTSPTVSSMAVRSAAALRSSRSRPRWCRRA